MSIFFWLASKWRIVLPLLVLALLLGTVKFQSLMISHLNREKATLNAEVSKLKVNKEARDARDKLEAKVMRLSDPDLDKRLSRWLRD